MELRRDNRARASEGFVNAGVTGLKALGAREMTYRLCFLACSVESASTKVNITPILFSHRLMNYIKDMTS